MNSTLTQVHSMDQLIQICNAFLVTNGLFFAALGAAETGNDELKVGLSAAGFVVSALWLISAGSMYAELVSQTIYGTVLAIILPALFASGWIASLVIHLKNIGSHG